MSTLSHPQKTSNETPSGAVLCFETKKTPNETPSGAVLCFATKIHSSDLTLQGSTPVVYRERNADRERVRKKGG